jgi:D-glycero-alpha-D-manno-heptose 1-phosphate guanylyltransferase
MAPVLERPFLEYQLAYLNNWGLQKVVLAVGFKSEIIKKYFRDTYRSLRLEYSVEEEPLGTGGALKMALRKTSSPYVLVMNGDTYFDVNLKRMHSDRLAKEADVIIAMSQVDDIKRFGSLEFDINKRITAFVEKGKKSGTGYVSGGVYLIRRSFLEGLDLPQSFSLEKDCFEKYHGKGKMFGMTCTSYFLDIGIPSDYIKAQHDLEGLVI